MARKRVVEAPAFKTWEEVDSALKEIAEREIMVDEIEGEMNRKINVIKNASAIDAKFHKDRIDKLAKDVKEFVTLHKDELIGKTKVMNFGSVGFRLSTKLSVPSAKDKVAEVLNRLKRRKMMDCVIVKETVNKDVLKKYDEEVILEVGCTLKKEDGFWYEASREKLQNVE